jgi:peptidoglycan-associated lipoprotein
LYPKRDIKELGDREDQNMKKIRLLPYVALAAVSLLGVACHKKVASAPPPPPAPKSEPAPAVARRSEPAPASHYEAPPAQPNRPRYPDAATVQRIQDLLDRIQDAYFDYDKHMLRKDAQDTLMADSKTLTDILKQYPDYKLKVEGYCDERGSSEYNMALGDARAKSAKEYLTSLGIPGNQLETVSYGKEKQVCSDHNEACWQKNRRAHVTAVAMNQ